LKGRKKRLTENRELTGNLRGPDKGKNKSHSFTTLEKATIRRREEPNRGGGKRNSVKNIILFGEVSVNWGGEIGGWRVEREADRRLRRSASSPIQGFTTSLERSLKGN